MCPPSSVVELHEYSTDETVIKSLMQIKSGVTLPSNVLTDVDPYQFAPSNLPPGMWYFRSGPKMDTKNGYWRSTGEACEIYDTALVIGLRKTLQFYEGPAHFGQKTNWMMQEFTTTEKYTSKMDPRALYRVFLVDDSSSGGQHLSKSEIHVKNSDDGVAGPSDSTRMTKRMTPEECFDPEALMLELGDSDQLLDDFLEINDLANPLSRTTSSADSSCMTMTSEDFFDSDALMRELGDDNADQETQDSRVNLNLSAPATLKQVVMQQATLGSVDNVAESEPSAGQTSEKNPTPEIEHISNEVDKSAPPSSSSSSPPPPTSSPPLLPPPSSSLPSSNGSEGSSKEEKKECADRTKKRRLMKYLCFLAF